MSKTLKAEKRGKVWSVEITTQFYVFHRDDVLKEIRQRGLKIFKTTVTDRFVFAD